MFLHERVVAVKGNRVEIEIEGHAPRQPQPGHGLKPPLHQPRVILRPNPTAVLGQKRSLRNRVQAREERQALV